MSKVIVNQTQLTYHKINKQKNDPQVSHPLQHTLLVNRNSFTFFRIQSEYSMS